MSDVKNDSSQYFRFKWCGCGYKIYPVSREANFKILTLDTSSSTCEVKFDSDLNKQEQIWEVLPKSDDSPDGLVFRSKATDSEGNPFYMSAVSGKLIGSSQKNDSARFKLYSTQGYNWLRFGEIYLNHIGWQDTIERTCDIDNYYFNKSKLPMDEHNITSYEGKTLLYNQSWDTFQLL
ncbi:MAG: hypothetical protein Q4F95_09240 [Oscillospiraceae bacterium]|nr:hypothetical protein [Oscillospiraceae bacterium]